MDNNQNTTSGSGQTPQQGYAPDRPSVSPRSSRQASTRSGEEDQNQELDQ